MFLCNNPVDKHPFLCILVHKLRQLFLISLSHLRSRAEYLEGSFFISSKRQIDAGYVFLQPHFHQPIVLCFQPSVHFFLNELQKRDIF